jgi:hypothetical protein
MSANYPYGKSFTLNEEQRRAKDVQCPKGHDAVWVDHGHTTGKGWFCRVCVDDVHHPDNIYGPSARIAVAAKAARAVATASHPPTTIIKKSAPTVSAQLPPGAIGNTTVPPSNSPNQPVKVSAGVRMVILDCRNPGCPNCKGRASVPPTVILPGDALVCIDDNKVKKYLVQNWAYIVDQVLSRTVRVWCWNNGALESREYTRCRFAKL